MKKGFNDLRGVGGSRALYEADDNDSSDGEDIEYGGSDEDNHIV